MTQIQQRELAIKEAELQHKIEMDKMKLELEAAKTKINKELQEDRLESEDKREGVRIAAKLATDAAKDQKEEAVKFSAFAQWCEDTERVRNNEITASSEKIEQLAAKIEKDAAHIKQSTARIQELDEDVGRWKQDTDSVRSVRSREKADFTATKTDLTERTPFTFG